VRVWATQKLAQPSEQVIDDERIVAGIRERVLAAVVEHLTKHQRPPGIVVHGIVLRLLAEPSLEAMQRIVPGGAMSDG
jgi:hypothetical protein